ncbi:MAG TPA: hypothetical protein VMH28_03045 [Candidatus Acidoferrales bacterium]|nr:hypothetical protein [Candidatus Acidoferrales bacterium]
MAIAAAAMCWPGAMTASVLYGGLGGHAVSSGPLASANDGALAIVDQATGNVTIVGHPAGVSRITGLAFDSFGDLFASTTGGAPFPPPPPGPLLSDLIQLNPGTGALISSVPITSGGVQLSIADLAIQPGANVLYGVSSPNGPSAPGQLYTIDTRTGIATPVGAPQSFFDSIAFAPNGTLYETIADFAMGPVNPQIQVLNPATGARVGAPVPTGFFFGALAVRPEDGALFGGTGDESGVYVIDPTTGAATLTGNTGLNFVGDYAFSDVPEPGEAVAVSLSLLLLGCWRARRHRQAAFPHRTAR